MIKQAWNLQTRRDRTRESDCIFLYYLLPLHCMQQYTLRIKLVDFDKTCSRLAMWLLFVASTLLKPYPLFSFKYCSCALMSFQWTTPSYIIFCPLRCIFRSIRFYIQNIDCLVIKEFQVRIFTCEFKLLQIASLIIDTVICPH